MGQGWRTTVRGQAGPPDAPKNEELLESRQQVQAMRQLHLVGLWAVIQGPPLLRPCHKRLCQALHDHKDSAALLTLYNPQHQVKVVPA